MASHRIGARLAGLSPELLLAIIKEQGPSRSQLCAIIEAQAGASDAALWRERRRAMASHRIGARLAGLSAELLLAIIKEQGPSRSQLCAIIEAQAGASDAALRVAEEHAARLVEQHEWILSEVLLSPDLAPHILAQLPTTEHAVKKTCRAWRRGWKETLKKRERPRLLVFGGHGSEGETVNSLERYDASTNEWAEEAVAPMLTARGEARMAALDGKLYAVGGYDDDRLTSVERYVPATNTWEAVAPMAAARHSHGVAVLDGKLYAVGGYGGDGGTLSSVERYDPAPNAWEAVAPMAAGRAVVGMAVLDGKLYAVGGYNNDEGYLSSVERYDPTENAWEEVAPMAAARNSHAVAVLDGKLYAVGGQNYGLLSSVERYDPATNAWEAVAPMAEARAILGAAALDGKLYAVGGYDEDEALSSLERYDPATNAWEAAAPLTTARSFHGITVA